MKRFAAMLLALLMLLPGFTHAEEEGYSVSVTFSMDREAAGSMLTSMLGGEPSGLDSMAEALSEMIGSIVLKASGLSSEQLTQVDLRIDLMDSPVVDMLMSTDNLSGTVRLASDSLWPGHALVSAMTAEEMAATTPYSHTRPDGRQYYTVTDCPYTAENIHRIATRYLTQHGVGLAEAAVDGWANSETHLRNILNDRLSSIGVGVAKGVNASGEESWYCVQLFLYNGYVISRVDEPIM